MTATDGVTHILHTPVSNPATGHNILNERPLSKYQDVTQESAKIIIFFHYLSFNIVLRLYAVA
jgi:hypothetical protein